MRLLFVVALLAAPAFAQDLGRRFQAQEEAAFKHYEREEWPEAIAGFQAQIALYADNPRPYYNIACCYARLGDAGNAATWLTQSIERGWRDAAWLAEDPDFAKVRASAEFKACVEQLKAARARDPDPVPRDLAPDSVPGAASAMAILRDAAAQLGFLMRQEALRGQHDFQKRLFAVYDVRRARLARYLRDHGDARDADLAAYERIRTSLRYADAGARVAAAARNQALADAEAFLRTYPTSPWLNDVRFLRAQALEYDPAALESLVRDEPGDDRVRIALCIRYARAPINREALRRHFAVIEPRLDPAARGPLMAARLLAKGMPDLGARPPSDRPHLFYCISIRDETAPARIAALRKLSQPRNFALVVVVIDSKRAVADVHLDAWLAKHTKGCHTIPRGSEAILKLWLSKVPTTILAKPDGTVLAVDPTDAELAR